MAGEVRMLTIVHVMKIVFDISYPSLMKPSRLQIIFDLKNSQLLCIDLNLLTPIFQYKFLEKHPDFIYTTCVICKELFSINAVNQ